MRLFPAAIAVALAVLAAGACQRRDSEPAEAIGAPARVSVDPIGAAPPQPNPNGGDTPAGAAGPYGASPNAAAAAVPGEPAAPGATSPPR